MLKIKINGTIDLWDDVALSKLMQELNIKPLDVKRFNIEGNIFGQKIDLENYQFRCRADTHFNYPRYIEAYLLKIIYKLLIIYTFFNSENILLLLF